MKIGIVSTWYERGCGYVARQVRDTLLETGHEVAVFCRREDGFENTGLWACDNLIRIKEPAPVDLKDWAYARNLDLVIFIEEHNWELVDAVEKECRTMQLLMVDQIRKSDLPYLIRYGNCYSTTFHGVQTMSRFNVKCGHIPWGFVESEFEGIYGSYRPHPSGKIVVTHTAGWSGIGSGRKNSGAAMRVFNRIDRVYPGVFRFILTTQHPFSHYPADLQMLKGHDWQIVDETLDETEFRKLMAGSDLIFVAARYEGLGLTYVEAIGAGTPVVTVDAPPMNTYIHNAMTGWTCDIDHMRERGDYIVGSAEVCEDDAFSVLSALAENPHEIASCRAQLAARRGSFSWVSRGRDALLQAVQESLKTTAMA